MSKHLMVVFTNPVDGKEDEFNDWYTNIHLSDVLRVPGFVAAQRFELSKPQIMGDTPYRYMAIYEIEAEDPEPVIEALKQVPENGMVISTALDAENAAAWVYSPITVRVTE